MISIRRLQRLAGLNETIADEPETNAQIEELLDNFPSHLRGIALDALDILKIAGDEGISVSEWADSIRQIHGDSDVKLNQLLKMVVTSFPFCVKKIAPKEYVWQLPGSNDDLNDPDQTDPTNTSMMNDMIGLTHATLNFIKTMGIFTADALAEALAASENIGRNHADAFVQQFLDHFSGMLIKDGKRYRMKQESLNTREKTMDMFRDLVSKK